MSTPEGTTNRPEEAVSTSADAREGPQPNAEEDPKTPILKKWYKAKDEADHYNRNLMQYGGAVAAVLTLLAGSGGIVAVATAVKVEDNRFFFWTVGILGGLGVVVTIALVILTVMLVHSFVRRKEAEEAVEKNRRSLIGDDPTLFLPTTQPLPTIQRPQ